MADIVSAVCSVVQCLSPPFNSLAARAGYISKFDDNLNELRTALEGLEAKRKDVERKVDDEELKGGRRLDEVERWLLKVQTIETNANKLVADASDVQRRRSSSRCCSNNITSTYRCGKKIFKMLREVKENLRSDKVPEVLTRQATLRVENGTRILGLYGIVGVGKTTLLTLICNKFIEVKDNFDVVIWVRVSKDIDILKIQDDMTN